MKYDVTVIGAGIVGLATAYRLLEKDPSIKVCVVEKESQVACHQTGHNSGVIHSGIYYKPGSKKAINCIRGYGQLIEFCRTNEIEFDICGKIIVATHTDQIPILEGIYARGIENGLKGLKKIDPGEIKSIEPHVTGIKGIKVPQAGIINFRSVAEKLAMLIKEKGGEICLNESVINIIQQAGGCVVQTAKREFESALIVNCTGLYSDKVARLTVPDLDVRIIPFRGEYYKLKPERRYLVNNLIYPVPDPNFPFLGVHFTRMISGEIEAGPNAVLAFGREGYRKSNINLRELFDTLSWPGFLKVSKKYWTTGVKELYRSYSKAAFTRALQALIPEIKQEDLIEGGAGVRAQACDKNGNLIDDFMILEKEHVINVCNAPSPAATSGLSIGEFIAGKALDKIK